MTPSLLQRIPWQWRVAALAFALSALLSAMLVIRWWHYHVEHEREEAYAAAQSHAYPLQQYVDRALSAVFALAALVDEQHGNVLNFNIVAQRMLLNYPGVSVLILAPDGIIREVEPRPGNEAALGLDLLSDPIMRFEALRARHSGQLTLAGPLPLRQGGTGLVGRLPVFLNENTLDRHFWGMVNVVMRLPESLQGARLSDITQHGLDYQLVRTNVETGDEVVIQQSRAGPLEAPVRLSFSVPNGAWTLKVMPREGWGNPFLLTLASALALLVSTLVALLARGWALQVRHRQELEQTVALRTADIHASREQLSAALLALQEERGLFTGGPVCVFTWSVMPGWPVEYASDNAPDILGYSVAHLRDPSFRFASVVHPEDLPRVTSEIENAVRQRLPRLEQSYRLLHRDGRYRWFYDFTQPVYDAGGELIRVHGYLFDQSRLRDAEEHVEQLAYYDVLTGLPNRALFNDRITHAITEAARRQETLALMFLDLDHFKNINDTLGHRIGDQVLVILAWRMQSNVREQDTVARLGGDEFTLLLPDTDGDGAAHVAQKLLQSVSQSVMVEGYELTVTPSVGIALFPRDGQDPETLLRRADIAMYRTKQGGRNGYGFYTEAMQVHTQRTLDLENALHRALERHQLQLHYQPQFDLAGGRIVGVEALLRWQHPELGWISPAEFIPLAEASGLIHDIGYWVLETALMQMRTWMDHDMAPASISVNLSAVQFRRLDLPDWIGQALKLSGVPADALELELTESVAQDDPQQTLAMLECLHALGVHVAIDDFGTGYSSLSQLRHLQVRTLKIDQSFVQQLGAEVEDRAIINAIIALARTLNLQTVAEGVETQTQLDALRELGCNVVQGYFFSRPLPADELTELLRANPPQPFAR